MRIVASPGRKSLLAALLMIPLVLVILAAATILAPAGGGKGSVIPTVTPVLPAISNGLSRGLTTLLDGKGTPSSTGRGSDAGSTTPLASPQAGAAMGSAVGGPLSTVLPALQSRPTLSIVSGPPVPLDTASQSLVGTTTDDGVNVRSGLGSDYGILVQLPTNTRVQILAEQTGWYHVHTLW